MKKKGIKVVVDYTNGYYNVIGVHNNRPYQIRKPIRGLDRDGYFKASYSKRLIDVRRKEMQRALDELSDEDPNFKYSKKMISKIDPLMYKVLEDWDILEGTTYATDYLKIIVQSFEKNQAFYSARSFYEEELSQIREDALRRAGIDISYNVGLLNVRGGLNLADRVKGMSIAKMQKKLFKANVHSSVLVKHNYYQHDVERFQSDGSYGDYDYDYEDKSQEQDDSWDPFVQEETTGKKKPAVKTPEEIAAEAKATQELEESFAKEDERIRKEVAKKVQEIMAEMAQERAEEEKRLAKEKKRIEDQLKALEAAAAEAETKKKAEEQRLAAEAARLKKEEERLAKEREDQRRAQEEQQQDIEEQAEAGSGAKKPNTAERTGLTKKQRESAARKAKKEEKSHFNTQMRLKAEREARLRDAQERMQRLTEKRIEIEEQRIALEEARRKAEEDAAEQRRIALEKENAKKLALEKALEEQRLAQEKALQEQRLAEEKAAEERRLALEQAKLERQQKLDKLTDNRVGRTIKAGVRHWTRKIRSANESIKNFKFGFEKPVTAKEEKKSKTKAESKTESKTETKSKTKTTKKTSSKIGNKKMDMPAAKRMAKAGVRHWTRKIRSAKESIRNMKFKPHLGEKGKKRLITGAVTLLVAGAIFVGVKTVDNYSKNIPAEGVGVEHVQDGETSESDIIDEIDKEESGYVQDETEEAGSVEQETGSETEDVEQSGSETGEQDEIEQDATETEENENVEQDKVEEDEEQNTEQDGSENDVEQEDEGSSEMTEEEKIEEFKKLAMQKFEDALVIGSQPQIGDILMDQTYSQNPDGTGRKGYFSAHPDYSISHINIITNEGFKTVRADGRNLTEILADYPDFITYNVHFVNSKGTGLGFITQQQYEKIVQNKINQIIESRADKTTDSENEYVH